MFFPLGQRRIFLPVRDLPRFAPVSARKADVYMNFQPCKKSRLRTLFVFPLVHAVKACAVSAVPADMSICLLAY